MESIYDGMSGYYSGQLSRNIRRGKDNNAENGLCSGHKVFGYGVDYGKHYVLDEKAAPLVKGMFEELLPVSP